MRPEDVIEVGIGAAELVSMEAHPAVCNAMLAVSSLATVGALHAITRGTEPHSRFRRGSLRAGIAVLAVLAVAFLLVATEWQVTRLLCFFGCPDDILTGIVRSWLPWIVNWSLFAACGAAWNAPWLRPRE